MLNSVPQVARGTSIYLQYLDEGAHQISLDICGAVVVETTSASGDGQTAFVAQAKDKGHRSGNCGRGFRGILSWSS